MIYQTNELYKYEKRGVQTFLQAQVDGVLASISKETINLDHYNEIKKRGVPLILFDRVSNALDVSSVVVNDYAGAFAANRHLIEQGCKRIVHIGGQQHVNIFNQRLKGYIDALNVHNIPVNEDLIIFANEGFAQVPVSLKNYSDKNGTKVVVANNTVQEITKIRLVTAVNSTQQKPMIT